MSVRRAAAPVVVALALGTAGLAGADSFTPVVLTIKLAPVARLHQPLAIRVAVSADPGVLDARTAPLRVRVKLASECGGSFATTPGATLLDKRLKPQPTTGHAYSGSLSGTGKPGAYGVQTACVFLEEEGDQREFATDQSVQVDVSKPCTTAAARYDRAVKALTKARRRHHGVAHARAAVSSARRAALRACGHGVPL